MAAGECNTIEKRRTLLEIAEHESGVYFGYLCALRREAENAKNKNAALNNDFIVNQVNEALRLAKQA